MDFRIGARSFPLVKRLIPVGGKTLALHLLSADGETLDRIVEQQPLRETSWPYWLEEWPTTYALGRFLLRSVPALRGPVIDLGCGSGFLGKCLQAFRGTEVLSLDFNAEACRLARLNQAEGGGSPPGILCADLRHPPFRPALRFGTVLASEIIYHADNIPLLLGFLERHLEGEGLAYVGDPGRSSAASFRRAAEEAGFRVDFLEIGEGGEAAGAAAAKRFGLYRLSFSTMPSLGAHSITSASRP